MEIQTADLRNFSMRAREIAQKIIDAYGKDPAEYDGVEQQALSAVAFGAITVPFYEEGKVSMAELQGVMMGIFITQFKYDAEIVMSYFDFLAQCTQKEFHPAMNAIIHLGIDAYDALDRPEDLRDGLYQIIASL